jgi:hypothetical protein
MSGIIFDCPECGCYWNLTDWLEQNSEVHEDIINTLTDMGYCLRLLRKEKTDEAEESVQED